MLKNYFKILLRNIAKNRVYAFINIFGLAIGISASTLIGLFIIDEITFDHYHENADRVYRVSTVMDFNGPLDAALTNMALAPTLKKDYPEVEAYARFFGGNQEIEVSVDHEVFSESNIWFTDSSVFDVFTYDFARGDKSTSLINPNSIVLTNSTASKLFGHKDCIGKGVKVNNTILTVTGVIKDPPYNSEIPVSGLVSLSTLPAALLRAYEQDWFRLSCYTFLLLNDNVPAESLRPKLDKVNKSYVEPWAQANGIVASHKYSLTPLTELHFDEGHDYDLPKGQMRNIYMFSLLAIFLLLIAAFNYINLTLSQQTKRSKEVGVRKALGATKRSLILQFLFESIIYTTIAVILGLAFTELFLGKFNAISGKNIHSIDMLNSRIILLEVVILMLLGVLSGAYPAFILSSFKPIKVLNGVVSSKGSLGIFRKVLILMQFVFSVFMIAGTMLINDQMNFIHSKNLGFDRENLISIKLPADTGARKKIEPWLKDIENDTRIVSASRTSLPSGTSGELMFRVEKGAELKETTVRCLFIDDQFIEVLGLEMKEGRNFSREYSTEQSSAFIVNETAKQAFGWGDNALNKKIQWGLLENGQAQNEGKVVGVVSDFNFLSLHNPLEPLILCYNPNSGRNLSVRLSSGDYSSTIRDLEQSWKSLATNHPFDFTFFDQELEANYVEEEKVFSVFTYFSGISIILACLGLFALLSYSIQSRAKEIGVRKVLGASLFNLSWVIAKDFLILMSLAFIISAPLAFLLWRNWQGTFAYKVDLNISSFILTFIYTIVLALIAVAYHSWKISKSNSIVALRQE